MEINVNKYLMDAIEKSIHDAIKSRLTSNYNNPMGKIIDEMLAKNRPMIEQAIDEALKGCFEIAENRKALIDAMRKNIAKSLIQRFGGEVEKQVNALKRDPATRARITLAIEEIARYPAHPVRPVRGTTALAVNVCCGLDRNWHRLDWCRLYRFLCRKGDRTTRERITCD